MSTTTVQASIDRARLAKANVIVATLQAHGFGTEDAAILTDEQRTVIVRTAGYKSASDMTWWIVLGKLRQAEVDDMFDTDPRFALCPDCQRGNPRTETPCTACATERRLELVADRS